MSDLVNDLRQRATEVHPLDGSLPLLLQAANELAALKLENEKLKKDKYEITKSWLETIEIALRQKEEIGKLIKEQQKP